jgi:hypothetical protein
VDGSDTVKLVGFRGLMQRPAACTRCYEFHSLFCSSHTRKSSNQTPRSFHVDELDVELSRVGFVSESPSSVIRKKNTFRVELGGIPGIFWEP